MNLKLHLMDDRHILKTAEVVKGDIAKAFDELLDCILDKVEEYPCQQVDSDNLLWKIIRADVAKAKRCLPTSAGEVTDFRSEMFNMVVHGYA